MCLDYLALLKLQLPLYQAHRRRIRTMNLAPNSLVGKNNLGIHVLNSILVSKALMSTRRIARQISYCGKSSRSIQALDSMLASKALTSRRHRRYEPISCFVRNSLSIRHHSYVAAITSTSCRISTIALFDKSNPGILAPSFGTQTSSMISTRSWAKSTHVRSSPSRPFGRGHQCTQVNLRHMKQYSAT